MGILYDIVGRTRKRCTMCGCIMDDQHDGDICEVCLDELLDSNPGEPEEVEPIDINHMWPKINPYFDTDIAERNYKNRNGIGGLHTLGGNK